MSWRVAVACVAMVPACSFHPASSPDIIDAATGSDGDATGSELPGPVTCWPRWHDHTIAFAAPSPVDSLAGPSNATSKDLALAGDELTLYFTSNRGTTSDLDIYAATRVSPSAPFDHIATVPGLDSPMTEVHVTIAGDGLHGVLAAIKPPSGDVDLFAATRGAPGQKFLLDRTPLALLDSDHDLHDPFLTGDGLTLYYAPFVTRPAGPPTQRIMTATRTSIDGSFTAPAVSLDSTLGDADPFVSPDQTVMVFSSARSGGRGKLDAWYVVRDTPQSPWSDAVLLGDIDTANNESDAIVSRDGCTLYFASDRATQITYVIYATTATP